EDPDRRRGQRIFSALLPLRSTWDEEDGPKPGGPAPLRGERQMNQTGRKLPLELLPPFFIK
ncbi:MAG: hypothetical protein WC659_07135, partial [Patescibacteria group bacterium]